MSERPPVKHPLHQNRLKYLVLQIHPDADPVQEEIKSNFLTGDGTLVAFTCDGYYADKDDAEGVARWLAELHPELSTHVVEIISTKEPSK